MAVPEGACVEVLETFEACGMRWVLKRLFLSIEPGAWASGVGFVLRDTLPRGGGTKHTFEIFRIKYEALKKINIYDTSQSQRASSYWKEVLGH